MKKLIPVSCLLSILSFPCFAQQTDPTLTGAVLGQTAAMQEIHKKRKSTQEKIIAAEAAVTVALDRVHNVENKLLDYLSNASAAMQNIYQLQRSALLIGKEIPDRCEKLAKAVPGHLKGTAISVLVSDEIRDVYTQLASLGPFMYQLVTSGTYNVTNGDGEKEKHKVNLLNAAERYYIANEIVSKLESINIDLYLLTCQVQTLSWNSLWYRYDPEGWITYMSGKNRVEFIISQWKGHSDNLSEFRF